MQAVEYKDRNFSDVHKEGDGVPTKSLYMPAALIRPDFVQVEGSRFADLGYSPTEAEIQAQVDALAALSVTYKWEQLRREKTASETSAWDQKRPVETVKWVEPTGVEPIW